MMMNGLYLEVLSWVKYRSRGDNITEFDYRISDIFFNFVLQKMTI